MDDMEDAAATVERLLTSISRIRAERDELRRHNEFLQLEHKFKVDSLEKKLEHAIMSSSSSSPTLTDQQPSPSPSSTIPLSQFQHCQSAAVVSALVAQHYLSRCETYRVQNNLLSDSLYTAQFQSERADKLAKEKTELLKELESQNLMLQESLGHSESKVASAESRIQELSSRIEVLEQDYQRERKAHEQAGTSLADAEAQLKEVNDTLDNVESERNSLQLEVSHLSQDLENARQELKESESRYSELQAQQLASMSSSDATKALRDHIEALEQRIDRRTEQIGLHQRDIKRLETNTRLQEDRLAEMQGELDVLTAEKHAMVEDCETTREQRDDALMRVEELEETVETMDSRLVAAEARHTMELQTLVGVTMQSLANRRRLSLSFAGIISHQTDQESALLAQLHDVEQRRLHMESHCEQISQQHRDASSIIAQKDVLLQSVEEDRSMAIDDARQATIALAAVEIDLRDVRTSLHAANDDNRLLQTQLDQVKSDLLTKINEISSLQSQIDSIRAQESAVLASDTARFTSQIADLEEQCKMLRETNVDLESRQQQTLNELTKANEDLHMYSQDEAQRVAEERRIRTELKDLHNQYEVETRRLHEDLEILRAELEETKKQHENVDLAQKQSLDTLVQARQTLEQQLAEADEKLKNTQRLDGELGDLQTKYDSEVKDLRERLDCATRELSSLKKEREELVSSNEHEISQLQDRLEEAKEWLHAKEDLEAELEQLRVDHSAEIRVLENRLEITSREHEEARQQYSELDTRYEELRKEISHAEDEMDSLRTKMTTDADELQSQLKSRTDQMAAMEEKHREEMRNVLEKYENVGATESQLREEITLVQDQLQGTRNALQAVQEEKQEMQLEMTNLEAEIQKSLSMQRYHESRINDCEHEITSLKEQLGRAHADLSRAEKAAKTAEVNLSMQEVHHDKALASLHRELDSLRGNAKLQNTVADLQEKNAEMEDLLRAKCLEIEENDDRFIELLKEKKKLNSKIDSLTRKVNTLQGKLAAATSSSTPEASASRASQRASSSQHQSPATSTLMPAAQIVPPVPSLPNAYLPSVSAGQIPSAHAYTPTTPNSRGRYTSVPSSLPRPKTPEARVPPPPVFKARTPESKRPTPKLGPPQPQRHQHHDYPLMPSASSSAGKKRRAPDDFEDCDSVPPQVFTSDSLPSEEPVNTPRLRRALHSVRSGFTPVRHVAARVNPTTSPVRRATTGAPSSMPAPPIIHDVTNSPRGGSSGETKSNKRSGWLGKIRGGAAPRSVSSRPVVFERAQNPGPSR
ncbi:hypothetical protein ABKN59_008967 [Abortiporus biennis]